MSSACAFPSYLLKNKCFNYNYNNNNIHTHEHVHPLMYIIATLITICNTKKKSYTYYYMQY